MKLKIVLAICLTGICFSSQAQLTNGIGWVNGYYIAPHVDLSNADLNWADLSGANLSRASLNGAGLYEANLDGANLSEANLNEVGSGGISGVPSYLPDNFRFINGYLIGPRAHLDGADLSGADLSGADLYGAFLTGANLSNADLNGANLRDANFPGANLNGADLSGADLGEAYLYGADLSGAYLVGACFVGADLSGADLSGADVSGTYLDFQSKAVQETIATLNTALSNEYTLAEIVDMRSGSSLLAVSNGMAQVGMVLETSTNLVDWVTTTNMPAISVSADTDVKFFRYRQD